MEEKNKVSNIKPIKEGLSYKGGRNSGKPSTPRPSSVSVKMEESTLSDQEQKKLKRCQNCEYWGDGWQSVVVLRKINYCDWMQKTNTKVPSFFVSKITNENEGTDCNVFINKFKGENIKFRLEA